MAVTDSLKIARFTLQTKRIDTANALFDRAAAQKALEAATRDFPADSQEVQNAQGAFLGAVGAVNAARTAEATARTNLNNEIATWLKAQG